MSNAETTVTFANARAQAAWDASGLPAWVAPVVRQDAHYMMNCTNTRYSDAVASACYALTGGRGPASTVAQAMLVTLECEMFGTPQTF